MSAKRPTSGGFIQPLDGCCCGLHLDFGIKIVLAIHAFSAFFFIYTCLFNIVLERPTFGYNVTLYTQTFNCAWGLATIPFIASGISGVRNHVELHLRVYMYWLMVTVGMDLFLTGVMLNREVCSKIPSFLQAEGAAFACGTMRTFSIIFLAMLFGFALYAIFVVWSRCEELQDSGSEPSFDFLIGATRKNARARVFQHKSGLFGTGQILPAHGFPIMYGSLASPSIGGGGTIFGGRTHCTEFPPPHQANAPSGELSHHDLPPPPSTQPGFIRRDPNQMMGMQGMVGMPGMGHPGMGGMPGNFMPGMGGPGMGMPGFH